MILRILPSIKIPLKLTFSIKPMFFMMMEPPGHRMPPRHIPLLHAQSMFLVGRPVPHVRLETGPMLVEGDGMPEVPDVSIGGCEGETAGDDADGGNGIPCMERESRT